MRSEARDGFLMSAGCCCFPIAAGCCPVALFLPGCKKMHRGCCCCCCALTPFFCAIANCNTSSSNLAHLLRSSWNALTHLAALTSACKSAGITNLSGGT